MKKIYIVLTHTGTMLSKIIKTYTKDEFSHVSISLDQELKHMYSFGRKNPYNPFIGGFVQEYTDKGTFKRFSNTKTKIYSLTITEKQYQEIENQIKQIKKEKEKYKFNVWGLFAVSLHKKIFKKNCFYCAEFVKHILENVDIKTELPEIIKPEDFKNIKEMQEVYEGYLRNYKKYQIER